MSNMDKIKNIKFDLSSLNFNFETFDLFEKKLFTLKSSSSSSTKPRALSKFLLDELNANLIDLSSGKKIDVKKSDNTDTAKLYHLLYFCSNLNSNEILFENVLKFLKFMQERTQCDISMVLISSDQNELDFQSLIKKYATDDLGGKKKPVKRVEFKKDDDSEASSISVMPKRFALAFDATKSLKETLCRQMSVVGIPWFSLIDANTGKILCKNLKIFILNSQLRDIVF